MNFLRALISVLLAIVTTLLACSPAWAFCGFYVAKADAKLYNQASQVAIARDGNRTVLTMANDYQGDVKDFAVVVPVPVILQRDQINVGDPKIIERLDAFSAPRLVEYFDSDPCAPIYPSSVNAAPSGAPRSTFGNADRQSRENTLGVTVEARYTIGEYDILILSARESDGLETWLRQSGYRIPDGASQLLQPYIRQRLKFFVAKVNLEKFNQSGFQSLRPLQMAYESPRFMLPIRLGMVNAQSEQDLIVYLLSPKGQVELTNYRTVKIPSNETIPVFVKDEFNDFYKAMFNTAHTKENKRVAFLEYAWNMGGCDPCAADPLTPEEMRRAGVFWLNYPGQPSVTGRSMPIVRPNVFITRLHVRYARSTFPEDLVFQETSNQEFFQGRYVLQHPFKGELSCQAGQEYKRQLGQRFEQESQTLAKLTGWDIRSIRRKQPTAEYRPDPWWRNLWGDR